MPAVATPVAAWLVGAGASATVGAVVGQIAAGVVTGAVVGAGVAALTGEDIGDGALKGGLIGGAFSGITSILTIGAGGTDSLLQSVGLGSGSGSGSGTVASGGTDLVSGSASGGSGSSSVISGGSNVGGGVTSGGGSSWNAALNNSAGGITNSSSLGSGILGGSTGELLTEIGKGFISSYLEDDKDDKSDQTTAEQLVDSQKVNVVPEFYAHTANIKIPDHWKKYNRLPAQPNPPEPFALTPRPHTGLVAPEATV